MAIANGEVVVRDATNDDLEKAVSVLDASFVQDSVFAWLVPDPETRARVRNDFFRMQVKFVLHYGAVQVAEVAGLGIVGVNLTYPHSALANSDDSELEALAGEFMPKFDFLFETFYKYHPPIEVFEHIAFTGVIPEAHAFGIGGALFGHRFRQLDAMGIPTYCEAVNRRVAGGILERFGMQPIGEPIYIAPEVELYPMWRPAPEVRLVPRIGVLTQAEQSKSYVTGQTVNLSNIEWIVLKVQETRALLLSKKIPESRMFHHSLKDVEWANSDMRKYLNNEFYASLDQDTQQRIEETRVPNYNNPWFRSDHGSDTADKVFLLSVDEVIEFFGDSKQLRNKNPKSRYFVSDHFNSIRRAEGPDGVYSWWWLRTVGNAPGFITGVSNDWRIAMSGDFANRNDYFGRGIRPAMWVKL